MLSDGTARKTLPLLQQGNTDVRLMLLVFLLALSVYCAAAIPYSYPPSMDAYYYVDLGRALAAGQGLTESFVWNYLPPPATLLHPGATYWLPLLSALIGGFLALLGPGYWVERLPVLLSAAAYVAVAYLLARRWLQLSIPFALGAAGLTLFNGIWFHEFTGPDAFIPYALLATLSLALLARVLAAPVAPGSLYRRVAAAGLCAGLAALTRQEGILLVAAALIVVGGYGVSGRWQWPQVARTSLVYLGGFTMVWVPWIIRVLLATHGATGGLATLWMRSYSDFYSYHLDVSPSYYLSWGWANILASKVSALVFLAAFWLYLWQIFLVPLLVVGISQKRISAVVAPVLVYAGLIGLLLPLLFTFPSFQGTLQHASMSLLAWAAGIIMVGLERLTHRWSVLVQTTSIVIIVLVAASVSLWWARHSFGSNADEHNQVITAIAWLDHHIAPQVVVMVGDPPAFAYYSPRHTVIMPSNGPAAVDQVAARYSVSYWVAGHGDGPQTDRENARYHVHLIARLSNTLRVFQFER